MDKVTCVLIVISILTTVIVSDIPDCGFYDTVDLSDIEAVNESYTYKNVRIPKNETGEYNITTALLNGKKPVANHRRGCLCKVKKCVLFCCEPSQDLPNAYMNISFKNNTKLLVDALKEHVVQAKFNQSCDNFFVNEKNNNFAIQEV